MNQKELFERQRGINALDDWFNQFKLMGAVPILLIGVNGEGKQFTQAPDGIPPKVVAQILRNVAKQIEEKNFKEVNPRGITIIKPN